MPSLRELIKGRRVGPLHTPWIHFETRSRIALLLGQVASSTDTGGNPVESIPHIAEEIIGTLMLFAQEDREKPIKLLINSTGGSIQAGFMIIETIEHLQKGGVGILSFIMGESYSMATVIAACCRPRYSTSASTIHIHMPTIGIPRMREADAESVKEFQKGLSKRLYEILASHTRIPEYHLKRQGLVLKNRSRPTRLSERAKLVRSFLETEQFFSPEQAKEAGIIDDVLYPGDKRINDIYQFVVPQE